MKIYITINQKNTQQTKANQNRIKANLS